MPTNRLTNSDFSAGSASWTTDSPVVDATRVYEFTNGVFRSSGDAEGSISQLISVTPGETLFLSFRGFAFLSGTGNHRVQWGVYIPASGQWRCISDTENTAPRAQYWPTSDPDLVSRSIPGWLGGEVTIPAGVTQVRVAVVLPPGVSWLTALNCYTSPNLVTDGDFSTNTDGTLGGDGATPEDWTLDWEVIETAAMVFDAVGAGGSATSGTTVTWSHTIGSGANRLLVVGVALETDSGRVVSGVTYNGVALTAGPTAVTGETVPSHAELWYLLEASMPAAGAYNVVVTISSALSSQNALGSSVSFSGAQQSAPTATATSVSDTNGTTYSTPITTVEANATVIDVIASNTTNTWTADGGQNERWDRQEAGGAGNTGAGSTKAVAAAGATTLGWTASGSNSRHAHALAAWPGALTSGWTTAGGSLKHTGANKSGAASGAFSVTEGELLYVEARAISGTVTVKIAYANQAAFTAAQRDTEHTIVENELISNREIKFGRFVTVPAGMTHARIVVYSMLGSGSCYFLSTRVRRLSTMAVPSVRLDVSFGAAGMYDVVGQDGWVVGASDDTNDVGTSFMSGWPETYSNPWAAPFVNVSSYLRSIDSMSRGRNSKQDEFETGTLNFTLDNNTRRFDPLLTTGPYYIGGKAYMGVGYAVRLSLEDGDTGEPVPMFSGRVTSWKPRFKPNDENLVEVAVAEYYPDLNASAPDFSYASYLTSDFVDSWLGANGLNWDTEWKSIDVGSVTVPALTHTLGSLLARARAAARTENGRFYLDPEGKPTLRIDALPRMTASNASFDPSDITDPDRLDYEDADIEYDNDLVRNFVTATREGGADVDLQYAEDTASSAEVGRVEYAVPAPGLLFQTNAEVLAWCEAFVADFAEPGPRVSAVELWPLANPMQWGLIMWAQYGDRFTMVVEPPPSGSASITQDVQYEGVSSLTSRNDAEGGLKVRWTLVPATT